MVDYKELLRKYIALIVGCEGVDFVDYIGRDPDDDEPSFTDEEIEVLKDLADRYY